MFSQGALKNQVRAGRFSGFNRPNQLRPVCCLRALDLNVIWMISEEGASACFRDGTEVVVAENSKSASARKDSLLVPQPNG